MFRNNGHTSGFANGMVLIALLALLAAGVVAAIVFGIAAFFHNLWAFVIIGIVGVAAFTKWIKQPRGVVVLAGASGGLSGWLAFSVSTWIGGVLGAIAGVFAGAIACIVLILMGVWFLPWGKLDKK